MTRAVLLLAFAGAGALYGLAVCGVVVVFAEMAFAHRASNALWLLSAVAAAKIFHRPAWYGASAFGALVLGLAATTLRPVLFFWGLGMAIRSVVEWRRARVVVEEAAR